MVVIPALHFVSFHGDEYVSAVRIWGKPDFFHPEKYGEKNPTT